MFTFVPMDVAPLIDRSNMPQIEPKQYGQLIVFLSIKQIGFTAGMIEPGKLKLHQEIDVELAMSITPEHLKMPIIIAQDDFVLDGDHRGYRHWLQKTPAPYIQIDQTFEQGFKTLFDFINGR